MTNNPIENQQFGGSNIFTPLINAVSYFNSHIMYLNNSKFFAGVIMILLNIGSKFIVVQFSKSTEEYMKYSVSKQLLIFAMAWMGTRDITEPELAAAIAVLEKAKKEKQKQAQKKAFSKFDFQKYNYDK